MKKLLLVIAVFALACNSLSAQTINTLTPKQHGEGWVLLFDGTTTKGWHTYLKPTAGAWKVVDSALQLDPYMKGRGDLVTDKEYENFEFITEWKIAEGGNSGIIFSIHEDPKYPWTFITGLEMQVLDDKNADDNKQANHRAGALYDIMAPSRGAKPAGQWNRIKIIKDHGHLTFWMNGYVTIDTQIGSKQWQDSISYSKFKGSKEFAAFPKGHIAFQDHGGVVSYRDIKIREL